MRIFTLLILLIIAGAVKGQTFLPGAFVDPAYRGSMRSLQSTDSTAKKKWSVSKYGSVSTSYTFFKGGNAMMVSAPMGLQLNRKLTNNLYAFAGVSVAPAYINFNRAFITTDFNKATPNAMFLKSNGMAVYSRAELGLQYVNDEKTFSISGSIGIERNNYPMFQQYPINSKTNAAVPVNQ